MAARSMPHVLMTNHLHLPATPKSAVSLPRMMQSLERRYVRHVNAAYHLPKTTSLLHS